MIKDKLKNANTYYNISENLIKGFEWLENNNLETIADGKYEIDGNNVYASVQTYKTKETAMYEAHRNYIDIQYMINGCEKIGITHLDNCLNSTGYDKERDLEFFHITNNHSEEFFILPEGYFTILFPHDSHKPSIAISEPEIVKKVVVKVKI